MWAEEDKIRTKSYEERARGLIWIGRWLPKPEMGGSNPPGLATYLPYANEYINIDWIEMSTQT